MSRFEHRPKRISRRTERDKFAAIIMPAAYICFPVAVASAMAALLVYSFEDYVSGGLIATGCVFFALPLGLVGFRAARGHFDDELNEP